jgi:hypothetical protein
MIFNENKVQYRPGYSVVLAVFFAIPVWSEGRATVQGPTQITLEIALETAFENNPDIRVAQEKVMSAEKNYLQKRAKKYPSFGGDRFPKVILRCKALARSDFSAWLLWKWIPG